MNTPKLNSVLCVHMYDDFSGSSNICSQVLDVLACEGIRVKTWVGSHGDVGFIRSRHSVQTFPYRVFRNRLLLLFSFAWAQVCLFWVVARSFARGEVDLLYVSTVLPVGAVLAARLFNRPVISHLHETRLGSRMLFRVLAPIVLTLSSRLLCVSKYVADTLRVAPGKGDVLPNSLSEGSWISADLVSRNRCLQPPRDFVVVMACSLLWYKGIDSFINLAERFQAKGTLDHQVKFELILNADEEAFNLFLHSTRLPSSLSVIRRPRSVFAHYERSSLVVNLSHKEGWVETFGLTLLEAMACSVPVVCPVVGGCLDLFENGKGGWRIDSRDIDELERLIVRLVKDREYCEQSGRLARSSAERFSQSKFIKRVTAVFKEQLSQSRKQNL